MNMYVIVSSQSDNKRKDKMMEEKQYLVLFTIGIFTLRLGDKLWAGFNHQLGRVKHRDMEKLIAEFEKAFVAISIEDHNGGMLKAVQCKSFCGELPSLGLSSKHTFKYENFTLGFLELCPLTIREE